jgi:hypothetical protein
MTQGGGNATSQEASSQEATSQEVTSQEAMSQEATSQEATSQEATSQESGSSGIDNTSLHNAIWPADTELVSVTGTNKVLLTIQSPVMRTVFHTSFEHLRVSLLFIHAFPDPSLARSMASEAIAIAAHSHLPTSLNIHMRLQRDEEYMTKMCRLVSRIALILNINLLMLLATCSHCPFPRGGQGAVRGNYTCPILLNRFSAYHH